MDVKHPSLCKTEFMQSYLTPKLDLINKENKTTILLGDFNINLVDSQDKDVISFMDILGSYSFFPTINLPTRVTEHSETLIDNIFTNTSKYRVHSGNFLTAISDHLPQFAVFELPHKNKTEERHYQDWRSFDLKSFEEHFKKLNWKEILRLENLDPDISFDCFIKTLNSLIEQYVPIKKLTKKQSNRKPWITRDILKSISQRDKIFKLFVREKDAIEKANHYIDFKLKRNEIVNSIRESKRSYYRNFFQENISKPKNIWKGVNELVSLKPSKSKRANFTLDINKKSKSELLKIVKEFNKYFTNIADDIKSKIPPTRKNFRQYLDRSNPNTFFFTPVDSEEIIKVIKSLDQRKTTGPNSISNKVLQPLIKEISSILADIFNLSLSTGKFISKLKIAKVIPIYKGKGSEQDATNYRPITLLSNIDKVFEKLVHARFTKFINENNIIYSHQFGFRKQHSTLDNLICLTETIRKSLDEGKFSCAVFLDLQKAFDSVDHKILLKKLENYGFRGVAKSWVESYLTGRRQFVSINNVCSEPMSIKHGVPQGSVLGPLFFILYINDLKNCLNYSKAYIFADDTAINISHTSPKALKKRLNIDLKLLHHWLSANLIRLNVTKTETILFRHPTKKINYDLKLKLHGKRLTFNESTKYLGVCIDRNLNWKSQIDILAKKLRRTNGIISKLRHFLPQPTMIQIYHALFQSHLNYSLQVWAQNLPKTNRLQKLQKSALRLITFSAPFTPSLPIFRQLKISNINDLVFLCNIKTVSKTLRNQSPVAVSNVLNLSYVSNTVVTRGNTSKMLNRFEARTSVYGIFSVRYQSIIQWNKLQTFYSHSLLSRLSLDKLKRKTLEFLSVQSYNQV